MASMWKKAMVYLGLGPDEEYEDFSETPSDGRVDDAAAGGETRDRIQGSFPAERVTPSPSPTPAPRTTRPSTQPSSVTPLPSRVQTHGVRLIGVDEEYVPTGGNPGGTEGGIEYEAERVQSIGFENTVGRSAVESTDLALADDLLATDAAAIGDGSSGLIGSTGVVGSSSTRGRGSPGHSVVRTLPNIVMTSPTVLQPESFNEAQSIADYFKDATPVILNLQDADRELSRRLIDFSSGLCYGLGGQMERVASQVYLLTPRNVDVPEEERRLLRERGLHDG